MMRNVERSSYRATRKVEKLPSRREFVKQIFYFRMHKKLYTNMKNIFICSRYELHPSHWIYFLFINAFLPAEKKIAEDRKTISLSVAAMSECEAKFSHKLLSIIRRQTLSLLDAS